jgi:hypothetical protein
VVTDPASEQANERRDSERAGITDARRRGNRHRRRTRRRCDVLPGDPQDAPAKQVLGPLYLNMQVNACLLLRVAEPGLQGTRRLHPSAILDELVGGGPQTLFELCTRLPAKLGLSSTRQAVSAP